MVPESDRYSSMDAQRYDPSRRQKSTSSIGSSIDEKSSEELRSLSPTSSATGSTSSSWEERVIAKLASQLPCAQHFRKAKKANSFDSFRSETSASADSPSSPVVTGTTFPSKNETQCTDVFEHEDSSTTIRTIIRPMRSRTSLFCLSPKASFDNLTSTRSNSPSRRIKFDALNCVGGQNEFFEEEVGRVQEEHEKIVAGTLEDVRIGVYEEKTVTREERWRETVSTILYERPQPVTSVFGKVEVC